MVEAKEELAFICILAGGEFVFLSRVTSHWSLPLSGKKEGVN